MKQICSGYDDTSSKPDLHYPLQVQYSALAGWHPALQVLAWVIKFRTLNTAFPVRLFRLAKIARALEIRYAKVISHTRSGKRRFVIRVRDT